MVDFGVIGARVDALYAVSASALGEPRLLNLVATERPRTHGLQSKATCGIRASTRRVRAVVAFSTRPRTVSPRAVGHPTPSSA